MKNFRPYRFPPLSLAAGASAPSAAEAQASLADGFHQGMERGYREGHELGLAQGRGDGLAEGRREGLRTGRDEARQEVLAQFDTLSAPIDALIAGLRQLQADYQGALRREVVDLVAKVARQVIRSELALQPVQLLALVDETLATMPPAREGVEVFLNPEERERILELAPDRAARWTLIADPRLEPGECRVRADGREADAGCRQRLAACIEQLETHLAEDGEEVRP
ncbi:MAG: flagellar assembly protein H [Proteobacteria bacterium]|nr:flagellar assembly protein H [Pseudomonadota bacterium]